MSAVTRVRQQQPEPPRRKRGKRVAPLRDLWARRTPPAPDEVLGRAGKPLEPGVGRFMEEWLGHDFSAVRIHSDRDATALAETVGADAVAVGRDIFFAAGAYRPETAQGLRLLAHELLHTVQVPDAPGRLRLGRHDGTLSRPLDGVEREAEERVNRAPGDRAGGGEREVGERGAQPVSWLRFIGVDVSRLRAEQLDPAALVDRIVAGVVRTLRGDPADAAGRVRQQLVRLAPELHSAVLARLRQRLPSPEYLRIERLVAAAETPAGTPVGTSAVPEPVVEPAEREQTERRDRAEREAGDERGRADRERDGDEEERPGAQDRDRTGTGEDAADDDRRTERDTDGENRGPDHQQHSADSAEEDEQKQGDEEHRGAAGKGRNTEPEGGEQPPAEDGPARVQAQAQTPASGAAAPSSVAGPGANGTGPDPIGLAPVVGARVGTAAPVGSAGADPVREDRAEAVANDPQGPLAGHGLAKEPGGPDEPPEQEKPLHTEAGAESEVPAPDAAAEPEPPQRAAEEAEHEAGTDKPGPDPVPGTDPDLSAVPTADEELKAAQGAGPPRPRAMPNLPPPPRVEAEPQDPDRAEQAEQAAGPELERAGAHVPEDRAVEAEGALSASGTPTTAPAVSATVADTAPAGAAPAPTASSAEPAAANPVPSAPAVSTAPAEPTAAGNPATPAPGPDTTGREPADATAETGGPAEPGPSEPMPGDPPLTDAAAAPGGPTPAQSATPGQPGPDGAAPGAGSEGSLETGGGGCAGAPAATTDADAQGGGGGGGCAGGTPAPAEKKAEAQPPDVSDREPAAALTTISSQPPARMPQALGGVDRAVSTTVGKEHQDLEGAPPALERPSGAPRTRAGAPQAGEPVSTAVEPMTEVTPQTKGAQREADPPRTAGTPNPATRIKDPLIAGGNEEKAGDAEIRQLRGAVDGVPTSDGRLYTTVGAAPRIELAGATDPALADEQHRQTEDRIHRTHTLGRQDAAVGLGEDQVHPHVPDETVTASVPGRTAGGPPTATGGPGAAGTDPDTVSAVAAQERGPQIRAGFADGRGRMGRARQDKQTRSDRAEADNRAHIRQAIAENGDQQAAVRQEAREDAAGKRGEWRDEQDKAVEDSTRTATDAHAKARDDTGAKKAEADAGIEKRKNEDNDRIEKERRTAEEKARKEREAKKEESSGWWGWVKSKVKAAFDALVSAIRGLFDLAVKAIDAIKEGFKKAVNGLIDLAAQAITGIIKHLADALLAVVRVIGTVFPGIAEKMRRAIISLRDAAVAKVQQLADRLKKAVSTLIDALAGALVAVLRVYEKLLLAAVEAVRGVVTAAIAFVESAIKLLGELAALVGDIAPDPIGWIRRFGTAAREGVRSFLWSAIRTAVKEWFDAKVESVVGVGRLLWNVLVKGCMSAAQIGRMAWQAIVRSLPAMIVSIVIEKIVGLIVPALGGIVAIAQGVMAAYQSVSRIIAAFSAFLTFLKAVKSGGVAAACLFAKTVAAGAVALLDFIANFLMARIAGALKGVGTKLKGIAQKIMKGLGRGARGVRKTAGRAVNAARRQLRRGVTAVTRGAVATAGAVKRGITAGARAVRSGARRVGAAARSGLRGAAAGVRRAAGAAGRVAAAALKTVNRTVKRLGVRLANSRLGRALRASAGRLKDLVAKGRRKFGDWRRKVAESSRRNRRNTPKPEQAKEQRLARTAQRLRPLIKRLVKRGVRGILLRGTLAALRAWYRLSALVAEGSRTFRISARLNPAADVGNGFVVDRDRLLQFLRDLGREIVERSRPQGAHITQTTRPGSVDPRTKKPREIVDVRIPRGTNLPAVLAHARDMQHRGWGRKEILSYLHATAGEAAHEAEATARSRSVIGVARQQKAGGLRNKVVSALEEGREVRTDLKYTDIAKSEGAKGQTKVTGRDLADFAAGRRPTGANAGTVAYLGTLIIVQEGHRNIGSVVTSGMAIQTMEQGRDLGEAMRELPMSMDKAQRASDAVDEYLGQPPEQRAAHRLPPGARTLIEREIAAIRAWVALLDLHVAEESEKNVEQQLFDHIRARMNRLYFDQSHTEAGVGE
jgi:hypothetical protein